MEVLALLELLADRLRQPQFTELEGAASLVDDLERMRGDLVDVIAAAPRADPG